MPLCAAARPVDRAHNAVVVEPSETGALRGTVDVLRRRSTTWFSLFTRWTPLLILWMICWQMHHDPEALEGRGARDPTCRAPVRRTSSRRSRLLSRLVEAAPNTLDCASREDEARIEEL